MAKLGTAYVELRADMTKLRADFARARGVTHTAARGMGGMFKGMLAGVGVALLVRQLKGATHAAATFGREMAMVSTMLSGKGMSWMPRYEKGIADLSVRFGESTATLSKGLYDLLSASVAPAKALKVLEIATQAAKAGFTDTAVAVDGLTSLLNAYQLSASEAGNVSDLMFQTVKRGKITFGELASIIGRVAPMARAAGMSIGDMLAAIATMTRQGISGQQAAVRLIGILREVPGAGKDIANAMRNFVGQSLDDIGKKVTNIRAAGGIAALAQDIQGLEQDMGSMATSGGARLEAFGKVSGTMSHEFDRAQEALTAMSRAIGKGMGPAIANVATEIADWSQGPGGTKAFDDIALSIEAVVFAIKELGVTSEIAQLKAALFAKEVARGFVKPLAKIGTGGLVPDEAFALQPDEIAMRDQLAKAKARYDNLFADFKAEQKRRRGGGGGGGLPGDDAASQITAAKARLAAAKAEKEVLTQRMLATIEVDEELGPDDPTRLLAALHFATEEEESALAAVGEKIAQATLSLRELEGVMTNTADAAFELQRNQEAASLATERWVERLREGAGILVGLGKGGLEKIGFGFGGASRDALARTEAATLQLGGRRAEAGMKLEDVRHRNALRNIAKELAAGENLTKTEMGLFEQRRQAEQARHELAKSNLKTEAIQEMIARDFAFEDELDKFGKDGKAKTTTRLGMLDEISTAAAGKLGKPDPKADAAEEAAKETADNTGKGGPIVENLIAIREKVGAWQ